MGVSLCGKSKPVMVSTLAVARRRHSASWRTARIATIALIAIGFLVVVGNTSTAAPLFAAPFLSFDTGDSPFSVAIEDLNGDAKPDLVTANTYANTISVLLSRGDGTFGSKADCGTGNEPHCVVIGDLNGDSKLDLVTANRDANTVSVLLGNGDGSFSTRTDYETGIWPASVAIGDLNGDAKSDLVTANYSPSTVSVLLGNGDGTFGVKTDHGTGIGPLSVAIGDVNGDAKPDLATTDYWACPDFVDGLVTLPELPAPSRTRPD
jgi:hypothetical protein